MVDSGTSNEADYFYDLNNWRVKKTTGHGAASTYYVWEAGRVIAEYGTAAPSNNGVRYYHPDRLSTRAVTDTSGNVIGTEDTLPFGEDPGSPTTGTSGAGVTDPYRFTNYNRDSESGTDYAVNRQYSNSLGRMHQPDRVAGSLVNPQRLNRYPYSLNDPTDLFDPTGLDDTSTGGSGSGDSSAGSCKDENGNAIPCPDGAKPGDIIATDGGVPFKYGTYTITPNLLDNINAMDASFDNALLNLTFAQSFIMVINPAPFAPTYLTRQQLIAKRNQDLANCRTAALDAFNKARSADHLSSDEILGRREKYGLAGMGVPMAIATVPRARIPKNPFIAVISTFVAWNVSASGDDRWWMSDAEKMLFDPLNKTYQDAYKACDDQIAQRYGF